ncbi:MAG: NAD-dependent epimerase/dehydratase family protein [Deltaproteobacteria bacterium]
MTNPISHQPRLALVTGATGFIGSNLVRVLLEHGVTVRALIEPGVGTQNLNGLDVEMVEGDLRDPAALARAVEGRDTVYHLGAIFDYWLPEPIEMFRVNVEGTVNMMRAALDAGVKRVMHCSSVASIGTLPGEEAATEETAFNNWETSDDYVLSKYMAENEAMRFNGAAMEVVAGLPCMPFGRNDISPTPTGMLAMRYVDAQNPAVFTGGLNCVNVRDVARGFHLCATRGRPGESYIMGGHNVTYREMADVLCAAAGTKVPRYTMHPGKLAWLGRVNEWFAALTGIKPYFSRKSMTFLGGRYLYFDIAKARTELGYEPVSFEQTMEECARWFSNERERVLAGEVLYPMESRPERVAEPAPARSVHAE